VKASYEQVEVGSPAEWREWLRENHTRTTGIWLVTHKKRNAEKHVPHEAIVEEALAYGWVDSRPRSLDERRSQLLLTPRKPGSNWSRKNKERVQQLLAEDRMTPAGLAVVEAAKADGSWSRLDAVENLLEPVELQRALDRSAAARANWDAFPRSTRRAILEWIGNAKRADTREKRIAETARLAAENIRANQWRQPGAGSVRR